jgi:undecaprenyl-diphosphatase
MNWKEWMQQLDEWLFIGIHHGGAHETLDMLMMVMRNALTWAPLYLFVLVYVLWYRKNKALPFIVCTLIAFALADYGSASILKPLFQRLRPCFNADLQQHLRHLIDCGGRYGFPSSHASNHFALATCWFLSLRSIGIRRWWWVWIWALLIGYAQVYVGKHYPLDILGGAIYGCLVGWLAARLFIWWDHSGFRLIRPHRPADALT